jgi:ANTAR domain/GAF domain
MDDSDYAELLRRTMADLTRTASHPSAIGITLRGVTEACVELVTGAASADVLVITDPDDFESLAATSPLSENLDRAQRQFGEGPCLNAASGNPVVRCDDLRDDSRWPRFAKAAVAAGVHSMLSFQLFTHDDRLAALNIVGEQAHCFGTEAEALGAMLATHCAIALIADNREHQFQSALASRDVIGQAKGRIMERFDVDAVRAFDLLKRLSQDSNTKIIDVATQVVTRGSESRTRN